MKEKIILPSLLILIGLTFNCAAQKTKVKINFDKKLHDWDGFGVNYVEVRHTRDYQEFQQDYSGFKYLDEKERQEVIKLVFGEDGLKPAIIKMFADPFMEVENDNDDPYNLDLEKFDHTTTTKWTRYFATEGLKETRKWGGDLVVFAGIYGPPAFTTKQKVLRGRDLDITMKEEVAEFIVAWAKYLREKEGLNVKYISPHNEGEGQGRWTGDGYDHHSLYHHDYNMWWPYHQIVDWLKYADDVLYHNNMLDIKTTTGEASTWKRLFDYMNWDSVKVNLAQAIADDPEAMENLGLITSHGFKKEYDSDGIDLLREKNPGLHAWTTSYTWGQMDYQIIEDARNLIYVSKNNGLIPWATLHHDYESDKLSPPMGLRRSSNANSPIKTNDGQVEVTKAYYHFKQISRAGQPGMFVANVSTNNEEVQAIAFARNRTVNPDAFVIINKNDHPELVEIEVNPSSHEKFQVYCTSDKSDTKYDDFDFRSTYVLDNKNNNALGKSAQTADYNKNKWIIEMAIGWDELGNILAKPGIKIGFDVTLADSDSDGEREGAMSWHTKYNVVDRNPGSFGVAELTVTGNKSKITSFIKVEKAPVIDGEIDELWSTITANPIEKTISRSPSISEAYWKAAWDENGVYILVERIENKLQTNPADPGWKNDNVSLYFNTDYANDQFTDYNYKDMGIEKLKNGKLTYEFPARSVTTFFGSD